MANINVSLKLFLAYLNNLYIINHKINKSSILVAYVNIVSNIHFTSIHKNIIHYLLFFFYMISTPLQKNN